MMTHWQWCFAELLPISATTRRSSANVGRSWPMFAPDWPTSVRISSEWARLGQHITANASETPGNLPWHSCSSIFPQLRNSRQPMWRGASWRAFVNHLFGPLGAMSQLVRRCLPVTLPMPGGLGTCATRSGRRQRWTWVARISGRALATLARSNAPEGKENRAGARGSWLHMWQPGPTRAEAVP